MSADELMKKIMEYGADEEGILDRFGDNVELYKTCFRSFLGEPNFAALDKAVKEEDYEAAFEAAHALKGVSANLGITPFYNAICALVETLREKNYADVSHCYDDVISQYNNLLSTFSESKAEHQPVHTNKETSPQNSNTVKKKVKGGGKPNDRRALIVSIIGIVAIIVLVAYMFCRINIEYRHRVLEESGQHLVNTANQLRLCINERISDDWRVAESVKNGVTKEVYNNDEAIIDLLNRRQSVWKASKIILYTENGNCVYSDGKVYKNAEDADIVAKARQNGKALSVTNTHIIYTLSVDADAVYGGSKIVALSVLRDKTEFFDNMDFSAYDNNVLMYLTEENGTVISAFSEKDSKKIVNIGTLFAGKEIISLEENCIGEDILRVNFTAPFLMTEEDGSYYVLSIPVKTNVEPFRAYYIISEEIVNNVENRFSSQLIVFSVVVLILFAVCIIVLFATMYINRKKYFYKAMTARDRMVNLLVKNTRTAFALFDVEIDQPDYISSNARKIIGDKYWNVIKSEGKYYLCNDTNTATYAIRQANEMLNDWDGKSVFRSSYIHSGTQVTPGYFEFQLYPVDEDGKEFIFIAQDVTIAHEREEVAKNAMDMAMRANESKSRFLSNMSHDIRTPMNAIMNMSNFALENIDKPKKLAAYLHTIHESSEHLLHLINDVLDMSRIESGQTVMAEEQFDITKVIEKQVEMIKPLCADKEQNLIIDINNITNTCVIGDALKLSQIVMNLLSNAMKFTSSKGAVRLTVKEIPSIHNDVVDIRIKVEDNGMGISQENLSHIFEPFYRAKDKRVDVLDGTGLGLSICKSYAEAMGGTIRCESEEGEGTTFTVELFFKKSDKIKNEQDKSSSKYENGFLGMHCLVVEDNRTNQLITKELLERLGFIVEFANDGKDGVSKFVESRKGAYDVIYMDIQMPFMDGYEAATKIRESEHPDAKTIPIIAVSANAFSEDIEKAHLAGMDGYVSKPIVSINLVEQTLKAMEKNNND